MKMSTMKNNAFNMVNALLLGMIVIFLSSCASVPDQSLVGNYYVLTGSEEGSVLNLPADKYKVTKEDGYWRVWDRDLKTSVKVCFASAAVGSAYSSYSGGRGWDVVSKEESPVVLGSGSGEGSFVKETININGHRRMMVVGKVPGLVIMQDSGKSAGISGNAVSALFQYWSSEATNSGIAIAE
jgi:hypothetical protein